MGWEQDVIVAVLSNDLARAAGRDMIEERSRLREAARAGAQAIDLAAYRRDGTLRLDPAPAAEHACGYPPR